MLIVTIDEDMPEQVHITDSTDFTIKKRIRLGSNERSLVESWFKQAHEEIRDYPEVQK